ncbi:hypothetical protein J5U21_01480 [Saccharolobus shibatae]|uniref:Uncharacterized protein n=1 Tax=Saccharolobus shibatae TaxID=2286 RepID=A0A8F5GW89_9CREN|nr:hypothetical protein J5U21_01480 [Saccharolobus shibatae]
MLIVSIFEIEKLEINRKNLRLGKLVLQKMGVKGA